VNALLRKDRLVTSDVPGTTRDAIDSKLIYQGRSFVLTDTAGIRRQSSLREKLEQVSVLAAFRAMEQSDVVVLLLDAMEPAVEQDARLAGLAEEKGRALVVVVNKWDKVPPEKKSQEAFREELKYQLKFIAYAPILFTSALTGQKVDKVLELAALLHGQFHFRAPTPRLNRLLKHMTDAHPAPLSGGKPIRLYYIAQVGSAPPTFALTCNRPADVPQSYKRYIVNQLRQTFDLRVPIHLNFRERPGKAKRAARKNPKKGRGTH
jgi:GTPase